MTLPTPYYERDGITLYCGDCREMLPDIKPVDLVLTDPPWIAQKRGLQRRNGGVAETVSPSQSISYGEIGLFDAGILEMAFSKTTGDMLVICGFKEIGQVCRVLEPLRGVFVWHKPGGPPPRFYPAAMDVAFIVWGAKKSQLMDRNIWPSSILRHPVPTAGCIRNGERILAESNGKAAHPAQGPLSLYKDLLRVGNGSVLDCYCGTGTTLVAAQLFGRRAIGIELEERYCEMAVKRLQQKVLAFD